MRKYLFIVFFMPSIALACLPCKERDLQIKKYPVFLFEDTSKFDVKAVEGLAKLEIGADGKVTSVELISKNSDTVPDSVLLKVISKTEFVPRLENCKLVDVSNYEFQFSIEV
ncbi:hypothetical protein [Microbulbifer hydrolyticus]|uniref:TonB C-terminal domain-containing protein n=1 Tax=Microbulbifer hydrolyticus TaxID=48074 RepID=A0A6P1T780_9GAMM|nr:hypothetical protein [Microbulbifer hydrolyticus]MBB5213181.1 hypothetical protein [Microbulbifer hydrolyticus]QHQ38618.1 hypothetical protein GTQ55_06190 [Microbulbifer hydrolyticus]